MAGSGLVLHHDATSRLGVLGEWLARRGLRHAEHAAWRDPLPEDPAEHAWIVSLGSGASAAASEPAWVPEEIAFLRRAVAAEVPVLGLCFGGQALAVALGGSVGPAPRPEVGWVAVESRAPDLVASGPWPQFHWEAFAPPPGCAELARTEVCSAAFRLGPHLGLQFHPEATPEIMEAWGREDAERIAALGLTPEGLLAQGRALAADVRTRAFALFDAWLPARQNVERWS